MIMIGAIHVVLDGGLGLGDYISLALTGFLIVITAIYVKYTHDMVVEMRTARAADSQLRVREKSERSARVCAQLMRELSYEMVERGASAVSIQRVRSTRQLIDIDSPYIDDSTVRDLVSACLEVLFVAGWSNDELERNDLSAGRVGRIATHVLTTTSKLLETYAAGRPLDLAPWQAPDVPHDDLLPDSVNAFEWVRRKSAVAVVSRD
jgi:hypothetical protein